MFKNLGHGRHYSLKLPAVFLFRQGIIGESVMLLRLKEVGGSFYRRPNGSSFIFYATADGILYFPQFPQMGIGVRCWNHLLVLVMKLWLFLQILQYICLNFLVFRREGALSTM